MQMSIEKIKMVDAFKSTTMFLVDKQIEAQLEEEILSTIKLYQSKMRGISSLEGLKSFIRTEKDSVGMLETLLGISGEKMKRVVTMLRVRKGYVFDSEWDERRIQKELAQTESLMDEFCDLFLNGNSNPLYQELIPNFVLHDFKIDESTPQRLLNEDFMRTLVKARMIASYSSKYSQVYEKLIKEGIKPLALAEGLTFEQSVLDGISSIPCYIVTDGKKRIIITYSFQSTTSNNQNKYADNHISAIYASTRDDESSLVVNILDGAGWIGRSLAYKCVFRDCDYFLNLANIGQMRQIIDNFFN